MPSFKSLNDLRLGPTGKFPRGRADASDEGELQVAMAVDRAQGIVRIAFGKPTAWIGLGAADARAFAQLLLAKAAELDQQTM
jgi:hypothetical protein